MSTKAIRDSQAFYFEPRASAGENTLEELLVIVQKTLWENFVTIHKKWWSWKTEMEKFNWSGERLFPKHYVGIKEYVQQSHNDLKIYFKPSFNPRVLGLCGSRNRWSKHSKRMRYKMSYVFWTAWSSAISTPIVYFSVGLLNSLSW